MYVIDYYKIDNFDDSELQARLYAEIYYDSNVKDESKTTDTPMMTQLDSMTTEMNIESERLSHKLEEQSSASKTTGGKSSKIKKKSKISIKCVIRIFKKKMYCREPMIYSNMYVRYSTDSQKILFTNQTEFVQVNTLAGREMNPMAHRYDNDSPKTPSMTQGKENKETSSKNCKSSKYAENEHQESSEKDDATYSKYNVVSKCVKKQRLLAKQTNKNKNNSDSEESIFEVPIPPKPKPLLIVLQDSDEENNTNSGIDKDLIVGNNASIKTYSKITPCKNHELKIIETSSSHQNVFSKKKNSRIQEYKNINKSYNYNTINLDKNIQISTCTQEVTEDIILNCTTIQRGAKSVNEIKQLSKSTLANQRNKSIEDTNQNCKRKSQQNKSKGTNGSNANLQQEMSLTSGRKLQMTQQNVDKRNVYNLHDVGHMDPDKMLVESMESCNSVMDRKRLCNNEIDYLMSYPKQKRQCIMQQNNQDVMPQDNNGRERKNASWDEYLKPMSEEMRNYYNSSRGQENFDVGELQRDMSKDPRMWAILDEDIMPCPSSKQRPRFWNVRCTNCHKDGHPRYNCSSPRRTLCCYMCGMKGHTESRCPQKMCLTCGKQQNTFRNTCEYCRVLYCTMCNSVGHELEQCPDLWRRYHQTTDISSTPQDPGNVMKPSRLLYCCNCAKRGHESSTCREYRWSENFPTPAVVTNYTDGPTYTSCTQNSFEPNSEAGFLSLGATGNKTLIPQNANLQYVMIEDMEPSANVDTLSSNVNFYATQPPSQEVVCITQTERNLKSSVANNIWPTVRKNITPYKVKHVTFINITYSCGYFHNKNHKNARMILRNLTTSFTHRKPMLNSLINREVTPVFLKTLLDKTIQFEVKIGFTQCQTLSLQLLAMKEYIEYLYDLLIYWLNLPDDEKDWIDVTLPISPIKMFNALNSRMPQLEKMHAKHIGGTNDPRWIYNCITNDKAKLKQYNKNMKLGYNCLRRRLWRLQIKLLMIVNTEPKPNAFVRMFRYVMKRFESKRHQMGEKLDNATYLRFILLYNQLFVPHTSEDTYKMLHRIKIAEEAKKIRDNSLQLQEPEITVREQGNLVYNVYSSSMSSCTQQNINLENSFAINNQQNNEMLAVNEGQNINNISLEMSKTTDHNCDEIIKNSPTQNSQIIMPLNIEPMSADLKGPGKNEGQLSTSEVNIASNISVNKQKCNVNSTVHLPRLTKKERKELHKIKTENMYNTALNLVRKARAFKLPHMMNAANETQRQINNETITLKKIRKFSNLVLLEAKYQKTIQSYCKNLEK